MNHDVKHHLYVYWSFSYLIFWNACSNLMPFFQVGCVASYYHAVSCLHLFWIQVLHIYSMVFSSSLLLLLLCRFSCVRLLVATWTAAYQASLSMGFSRWEYWSGVPLPSSFLQSKACLFIFTFFIMLYTLMKDNLSVSFSFMFRALTLLSKKSLPISMSQKHHFWSLLKVL